MFPVYSVNDLPGCSCPGLGSAAATSAHRLLHERADPCLVGGGQLIQRESDRPHGAFVEVRLVAEAERRVPRLELLRRLEVADDLAVPGICGHAVPGCRREGWRAGFDDRVEPPGHGAVRGRQLVDLLQHGAFLVRGVRRRLHLLDAILHRAFFLVGESLVPLFGRAGALGGLLTALLFRFPFSHWFFSFSRSGCGLGPHSFASRSGSMSTSISTIFVSMTVKLAKEIGRPPLRMIAPGAPLTRASRT